MVFETKCSGTCLSASAKKRTNSKPLVLIIGGPDVDFRIDLIHSLCDEFHFVALGSAHELCDSFTNAGIDYHFYALSRRFDVMHDLMTFVQLVRLIRRLRPQIVHTFDTKPSVIGRLAAQMANVPVVIGTLPGLGLLYSNDNLKIRLQRTIYQLFQRAASHRSEMTMFQNSDDCQTLVDLGIVPPSKAVIIPGSGIPTDILDPALVTTSEQMKLRAEFNVARDVLLVTMIARVISTKGVAEYAAAANVVRQRYPLTRFLLVGPDDMESMDRLTPAERTQLAAEVTLTGARKDIRLILAASDLFVLPSYREGIPRTVLEAASMALPIVTTNVPGCRDVVEDGVNGLLVPARNAEALARAILRLIERPELRHQFGESARRRAVACFSLTAIASQIRSIYRQMLAKPTAAY